MRSYSRPSSKYRPFISRLFILDVLLYVTYQPVWSILPWPSLGVLWGPSRMGRCRWKWLGVGLCCAFKCGCIRFLASLGGGVWGVTTCVSKAFRRSGWSWGPTWCRFRPALMPHRPRRRRWVSVFHSGWSWSYPRLISWLWESLHSCHQKHSTLWFHTHSASPRPLQASSSHSPAALTTTTTYYLWNPVQKAYTFYSYCPETYYSHCYCYYY